MRDHTHRIYLSSNRTLDLNRFSRRTADRLEGVLSLATKYEVNCVRDRIVAYFEAFWPLTLWQWDALEKSASYLYRHLGEVNAEFGEDTDFLDDELPEAARIIRLGRKYDIPTILPSAFYHLMRLTIMDDEDRPGRADLDTYLSDGNRTAKWGMLEGSDFVCLERGRAKFREAFNHVFKQRFIVKKENCTRDCTSHVWGTLEEECRQSQDIFGTLLRFVEGRGLTEACTYCQPRIRVSIASMRQDLWDGLPVWFSCDVGRLWVDRFDFKEW